MIPKLGCRGRWFESSRPEPAHKINKINYLRGASSADLVSLIASEICDRQAALDDVRNWMNRCVARDLLVTARVEGARLELTLVAHTKSANALNGSLRVVGPGEFRPESFP